MEAGLWDHWKKNNVPSMSRCALIKKSDGKPKPISLIDVSTAFFIVGIGIGLAILALLAEMIAFYWNCEREIE